MFDICCVGHITMDKVVTPKSEVFMPGGTAFYFSKALHNIDRQFVLVTAIGKKDENVVTKLRNSGIEIIQLPSEHTVFFENIYPENQDIRIQRVLEKADPFTIDGLKDIHAKIFHLGSLLADDFSADLMAYLAEKATVSLDVQGLLREVRGVDVFPIDWKEKTNALQHVTYLKANESEMEVLTGTSDVTEGVKILSDWGVKEVIITLGSMGSVIYSEDEFHLIPAFEPLQIIDATGCGDTYMAGYLYCRAKGLSIEKAGAFAASMATLNIETSGPFEGTEKEVLAKIDAAKKRFPSFVISE
ncbi:PfkB family carbohydrate kinase [Rhizosphaericola mali]|uniref:Ribokinase n=1 Tax=Rhizosphaericola mali TaxID=2545455 RepID=A0A5P2G1H4_9BACT|nr:PfkB family carbohydrate kinase [Rhizosphaericola mali]QES89644.1 ribokinase [Rhizosphaericola mali]